MGAWNCPRGCAARNAHIGGHVDISRVFHRCFHSLLKSTLRVQTFQFYNYRSFIHFNIFNVWIFEEHIEHMFAFASMILQLDDKNQHTHSNAWTGPCTGAPIYVSAQALVLVPQSMSVYFPSLLKGKDRARKKL